MSEQVYKPRRDTNVVVIKGRLGAKPELRYTPQGKPVATLRIAVSDIVKNEPYTNWFRVITWNSLAENVTKHLEKGRQILVSGALKSRTYTDKNGNKRTAIEIWANRIEYLDRPQKAIEEPAPEEIPDPEEDLDDVPF